MVRRFDTSEVANDLQQSGFALGGRCVSCTVMFSDTQQRATSTCIGDAVNLAARLEAHTRVAGRGIFLDGDTQAALRDRVALDALGQVQFKGKGPRCRYSR